MSNVTKYNLFKGVSTVLTVGAPIVTLMINNDMFIHQPTTAISAGGLIGILLALLFAKDKIAENFKMPSAFVTATVVLVLIVILEHIMLPVKYCCMVTMITSGVDELTFKSWYKRIEAIMPEQIKLYKHFGFMFCKNSTIEELVNEKAG